MKKVLTMLLAALLIVTMLGAATGVAKASNVPSVHYITHLVYGDYMGDIAIYPEKTSEGSILTIPLLYEGFMDENNATITDWAPVDPTYGILGPNVYQLKRNGIVPRIQTSANYQYIKSIKLVDFTPTRRNPARAAVQLEFYEDVITTKELLWEFSIYLSLNDSYTDSTKEIYGGMLSNELFDVRGLDYLYIGDGIIAYCSEESVPLELDHGNGVSMYRYMYEGEKYYGKAYLDGNFGQTAVLKEYKDIVVMIDIKSVDVKINGRIMRVDKELEYPDPLYVYDLEGKYVGMSNELLPYSTKYYLSKAEIEIDPELVKEDIPVLSADEQELGAALSRFIEGGKASGIVVEED